MVPDVVDQERFEYAVRELAVHLANAGFRRRLRNLLVDYDFLNAKVTVQGPYDLCADFDLLQDDRTIANLRRCVQLATHTLTRDSSQLLGQLCGRLPVRTPVIRRLIERGIESKQETWLRPLYPSLAGPDGPLHLDLRGHDGWGHCVRFSADGRDVISGGDDETIRIWDAVSGVVKAIIPVACDGVRRLCIRDKQSLLIGGRDGCIQILNLGDFTDIAIFARHQSNINYARDGRRSLDLYSTMFREGIAALVCSNDGTTIVSVSSDSVVRVWNSQTGAQECELSQEGNDIQDLALTEDGRFLAFGGSHEVVVIWDFALGTTVSEFFTSGRYEGIRTLAFTPDANQLIVGHGSNRISVWDWRNETHLFDLDGHRNSITALLFAQNGTRLLTGSHDMRILVWDLEAGEQLYSLDGHSHEVTDLALSPDEGKLVSISADQSVKTWDLQKAELAVKKDRNHAAKKHKDWIRTLSVSPNGKYVVSGGDDAQVIVWRTSTRRAIRVITEHSPVSALAITPDSNYVLSAGGFNTLKLWKLATGSDVLTMDAHTAPLEGIAISPDCRWAITVSAAFNAEDRVKVWNIDRGAVVHQLTGHDFGVRCVAFAPDGSAAVTGGDDGTVRVWDWKSGKEMACLCRHDAAVRAVEVSVGNIVAGFGNGVVAVWSRADYALSNAVVASDNEVRDLTLTPDGTRVVVAGWEPRVRLLNLSELTSVCEFDTEVSVFATSITPDGRTIVAGDHLGRVHYLRLESK